VFEGWLVSGLGWLGPPWAQDAWFLGWKLGFTLGLGGRIGRGRVFSLLSSVRSFN
jgi:hypothetical protein